MAAYPNTFQGFNWVVLYLADLHAPGVLLAFHISNWATRYTVGSDTSTTLDVTSLGQEAGSFAAHYGTDPTARSFTVTSARECIAIPGEVPGGGAS